MAKQPNTASASANTPAGAPVEIMLKHDKDCKGSVRYATDDPKAVISNVYLSRTAFATMPDAIVITVNEVL